MTIFRVNHHGPLAGLHVARVLLAALLAIAMRVGFGKPDLGSLCNRLVINISL